MPWGIPVPGDEQHVMYVWFDALVNYISAIGWPDDMNSFEKWWNVSGGVVQYCGKDNLRQQSAMWQAMLMAAGLRPSKAIIVDGFITGEGGIKMSKSLGNTINPIELIDLYGTDAVRYFMAREIAPFEDSPFTMKAFNEAYNANLANGIGNLTSRIMKMAEAHAVVFDEEIARSFAASPEMKALHARQVEAFDTYNLKQASDVIWELIATTDKIIQDRQPFKLIKTDEQAGKRDIRELVVRLDMIATMLIPFMPETAQAIHTCVVENSMPETPLFLRK